MESIKLITCDAHVRTSTRIQSPMQRNRMSDNALRIEIETRGWKNGKKFDNLFLLRKRDCKMGGKFHFVDQPGGMRTLCLPVVGRDESSNFVLMHG